MPRNRSLGPEAMIAVALTALNAWIASTVFGLDYHQPLDSIEPVYMAIARWMNEHPDSDWAPLWYLGVPLQNAYPPLLPALTAWLSELGGADLAEAYHWLCASAYALGPASLYLLARTLGVSAVGAGAAALGMSLASPAALLLPSVWLDLGGAEGPRRLDALIRYGEGPHVLTLTLWPAALAALHRAVERGTPAWVGLAALGATSVALTNWLGSVALAAAALSLLLAWGWNLARWRTALGVGALAYALACPWLPWSTIQTIRANAPRSGGAFPMGPDQYAALAALLAIAAALAWALLRWGRPGLAVRFGALLTLLLGAPAAVMEASGFQLMPQPHRFHLELEQSIWLLAGLLAGAGVERFGRRGWLAAGAAAALLLGVQAPRYRAAVAAAVEPVERESMLQYRAAKALQQWNPEARLYAAGSVEYWLNVFTENPQVGGVFDQGVLWPHFQAYRFGVGQTVGDSGLTAQWLRAVGADAVFVSEPGGREPYQSYWRDPEQFRGVYEEIWREGADVLYAVPGASSSLAHLVPPEGIVGRAPAAHADVRALAGLDAALTDPGRRRLSSHWETPDHLVVEGEIEAGDLIFVQVAWHPGWDAAQDSLRLPVRRDGLGLSVVQAAYRSQRLDLRYSGTVSFHLNDGESWLHQSTRVVAGLIWLGWFILSRRRF